MNDPMYRLGGLTHDIKVLHIFDCFCEVSEYTIQQPYNLSFDVNSAMHITPKISAPI